MNLKFWKSIILPLVISICMTPVTIYLNTEFEQWNDNRVVFRLEIWDTVRIGNELYVVTWAPVEIKNKELKNDDVVFKIRLQHLEFKDIDVWPVGDGKCRGEGKLVAGDNEWVSFTNVGIRQITKESKI